MVSEVQTLNTNLCKDLVNFTVVFTFLHFKDFLKLCLSILKKYFTSIHCRETYIEAWKSKKIKLSMYWNKYSKLRWWQFQCDVLPLIHILKISVSKETIFYGIMTQLWPIFWQANYVCPLKPKCFKFCCFQLPVTNTCVPL